MTIDQFQARFQFVDADGRLTLEAQRFLRGWFSRIGGYNGLSTEDSSILSSFNSAAAIDATSNNEELVFNANFDSGLAEINKQISDLQNEIADLKKAISLVSENRKYSEDIDIKYIFEPIDITAWERPGKIGSLTSNTGAFTTISATGQITSTLATGTAPLVVASTTQVSNLNVSQLVGSTWAVPPTIGSTTPNTALFSTVTIGKNNNAAGFLDVCKWETNGYSSGDALLQNWDVGSGSLTIGRFGIRFNAGVSYFTWRDLYNGGATSAEYMNLSVNGLVLSSGTLSTLGGATLHTTTTALTNGAGAALGTLANAPAAGNPTKWIGINDNGTTRYIPAW